MSEVTEVLPSLGDTPRTADPVNFDPRMDTLLGTSLPALRDSANIWAEQVNVVAGEVNTNAATATTKAGQASTSADAAEVSRIASAASAASAIASPSAGGTSTTSLLISTAEKTLTTQTGKNYSPGQAILLSDVASPTGNQMWGPCVSYDSGTGVLVFDCVAIKGSGTLSNWLVSISANPIDNETAENYQEFTSSGTWTKPVGGQWTLIEVIGGGGGGYNAPSGYANASGGGGGGFNSLLILTADLAATESVTIGAGGTGAANGTNASGANGGTTSFGSFVSSLGGKGLGNGGGGEVTGTTPSGGYSSGAGGISTGGKCVKGGAGAGGVSGSGTVYGGGTSQSGGNGGSGNGTLNTKAGNGVAPGGGGGGSNNNGGGGDGGNGICRVWTFG